MNRKGFLKTLGVAFGMFAIIPQGLAVNFIEPKNKTKELPNNKIYIHAYIMKGLFYDARNPIGSVCYLGKYKNREDIIAKAYERLFLELKLKGYKKENIVLVSNEVSFEKL